MREWVDDFFNIALFQNPSENGFFILVEIFEGVQHIPCKPQQKSALQQLNTVYCKWKKRSEEKDLEFLTTIEEQKKISAAIF